MNKVVVSTYTFSRLSFSDIGETYGFEIVNPRVSSPFVASQGARRLTTSCAIRDYDYPSARFFASGFGLFASKRVVVELSLHSQSRNMSSRLTHCHC